MPWQTVIKIIDDCIQAEGIPYDQLTPREKHTREAMFSLTVLAPLTGAALAFFFAPASSNPSRSRWKDFCPDAEHELRDQNISKGAMERQRLRNLVRYYILIAWWFISVAVFGTLVYYQAGRTTRATFVLAVFHNQIEVLLNGLLLGFSRETCIAAALVYGLIMYPIVLIASSIAYVFIGAAIVGGANDMLIVCLLLYGKQWFLAAGAIGHVFSAVAVFTQAVDNIGVIPYNLCIFLGLWSHIGFTLVALLYAQRLHRAHEKLGGIDLSIEPPKDENCNGSVTVPSVPRLRRSPSPRSKRIVAHTSGNGHSPDPLHITEGFFTRAEKRSNSGRSSPHSANNDTEDIASPTSPQSDSEFKHISKHMRHELYRAQCFTTNPMRHIHVPTPALVAMLILSLVSATIIALVLACWAPLWGTQSEWGHSEAHSWLWNLFDDDAKRGRGLGANPQYVFQAGA
ncbi:hypothetical protein BKA62DRAFT_769636 [Auriculariales sp. MPI-PUGE-AT-0066]|nr:hypothetical protein BKA62DRAFT_769636 [Auriculariales sp. MPI-PUGE-AT-0066]